jgi:hypothetical protein
MPIVAHPRGQEIPWRPESDRFILEYILGVDSLTHDLSMGTA